MTPCEINYIWKSVFVICNLFGMEVKKIFINIRLTYLICLFLIIAGLAVYSQTRNFEFINYDDDAFVTDNPFVQAGLTHDSIIWAFTTTHTCAWQPLVWLSYMADFQFGSHKLSPGRHHMTNVLFHIASTLLLFAVFRRMTGDLWQSSFIAAMFAIHPLHAEAVAWISQRKDVLSAFFWMLTMWSYTLYVEKPGIKRYVPVFLFFTMGLMAKPMLVTLPFVLLLMDYWPLRRIGNWKLETGNQKPDFQVSSLKSQALRLICEKIPLFALTAGSSVLAIFVHHRVGGLASMKAYSLQIRIWNALISYAIYIGKMIWPYNLAAFYPYRRILSTSSALLVLVPLTILAVWALRRHPYFTIGWLWFMGTLVPVIGLFKF